MVRAAGRAARRGGSRHGGARLPGHGRIISGQYIVVLQDGTDAAAVPQRNGVTPKFLYGSAITGFAAGLTQAQLAQVRRNPAVKYVDPNGIAIVSRKLVDPTGDSIIDAASGLVHQGVQPAHAAAGSPA